jgi:hypothetical protein
MQKPSKSAVDKGKGNVFMTRTEIDFSELMDRVRKLERQNRCWKLASFFLLFVVASTLATGLVAQEKIEPPLMQAKTVEAQSFVLKDTDGTVRAKMTMKAGRPSFELYDQTGKVVWSVPSKPQFIPTR